ncbi:addiction module protein [Actomonas aquatica]|uniref:Addiction module protein n=1 Tax=Actomonas aquatica TaxID=2866162 RepID=A0ABZ1CDS5_9BACT|nr:addiction module protein [Opitutus sp. WL0086]WRQ89567.1 addiction module protein [Opitutus sp. WL0086]
MSSTVEQLAADALGLPADGRALLVEKLLASLAEQTDPTVQRLHLAEVRRRRAAARDGSTEMIAGEDALRRARAALDE